jgi:hypothetical protein
MDYTLTATVKEIFPLITGTNDKGNWSKRHALVEEQNGKGFKTDIMLVFWNERIDLLDKIGIGEERTFHFNIKSRKHKEVYFTEVTVWKVTP